MGMFDNGTDPTAGNAQLTGIGLTALDAHRLFKERTGTCPPNPRCMGFTGIADNYDTGGRQHSFIYTVYYFLLNGPQLRAWMNADRQAGDDLLVRKYNWVRQHMFHGVEFGSDAAPLLT